MMEDKNRFLEHIDKIHTTGVGIDRIRRNLKVDTADVVEYGKAKIMDEGCTIYKQERT